MKKDKDWLKGKLNTEKYYRETNELKAKTTYGELYDLGVRDGINVALEFIEQLDETQKPVVPQFVADYIERYKGTGITLGTWLDFVNEDEFERKTEEWIYSGSYEENLKREYLLIDAIRYGYEVEKGKKYYVDLDTAAYVAKWDGDGSVQIYTDSISGNDEYELHLTEQEIKDYDKRFWAFAEEVTE